MKKLTILFLVSITFLLTSCKKDIITLNPTNHLQQFSTVKTQIYSLDTLSQKEIIGEKGTFIYFNRKDFDINSNDKIEFTLKEYYDFKELLFNNIQTLTQKNELLESSGVIYTEFTSNGKPIDLKEGRLLRVKFPEGKLDGNHIFSGQIDSIEQMKWTKEKKFYLVKEVVTDSYTVEYGGGIFVAVDTVRYIDKIIPADSIKLYRTSISEVDDLLQQKRLIPSDSIEYYLKKIALEEKNREEKYQTYKINQEIHSFYQNTLALKLGYINIDKIIEKDASISFEVELQNKDLNQITSYFVYKNLNSFISNYHTSEEINYTDIPYIENKTSLIIVGNKKEKLFVEKIEFKDIPKSKIKVNLKETSKEEFKKIIEKHIK